MPEPVKSSLPAVELVGATKRYGTFRAADQVSLSIPAGEFFTILGSSGSGKTTTLRLIGGFELPDEGKVFIDGVDVSSRPAHRRDVHTVFQDYALFPHLSVYENIAFACQLKGLRGDSLRGKISEALELVQLGGYEKRRPAELSGGQQQRVALARAVVDRPAVLLLDEPLSALDAKIRGEVREELKMLQRDTGLTFVYVTHDQEEALTMSDRIAVMRTGKVLQVGTPIDIYERPADLFVAAFIGKANFLPGVLRTVDGRRAGVDTAIGRVEGGMVGEIPIGAAVSLMIRPENLRIDPGAAGPARAVIKHSSYLGHATEYLLHSDQLTLRCLELRRRGATPLREGAEVSYEWNWDESLVFAEPPAGEA
ncbi:MAG: ABC transporter ATP-binding protein [Chthoniobacterales bacterium]